MKKKLLPVLIVILSLITLNTFGQCPNSATLVPGDLTPPGVGLSTSQSYGAGQYVLAFVATGNSYTISTCGSSAYDTQLTVYDDASGSFLGYNDDFCGLQSTVNFTATTCGWIRVILMQYSCNASGLVATVTMTQNTGGSVGSMTLTAAPDLSICSGVTGLVGIANPASGGTSPYTYSWSGSTGLDSTTTSPTTFNATADASYVLTVTDSLGCFVKDTIDVTVHNLPVVNLGADSAQCGGSILLDAGNTGASYSWNDASTAQTLPASSSGTYYVAVTDTNSCVSSDTVSLTIHALPIVDLGTDTAECIGSVAVLDAGNAGATYLWNDTSTNQTLTPPITGNYSVTVTDTNGCIGSDSVHITINPNPIVNLGVDSTQCGGTVVLDAGNAGATYLWNDASSAQTLTASSSGNYAVTVTDTNGCTGTDDANITINPLPTVTLSAFTSSVCLQAPAFNLSGGSPAGGIYSGTGVTSSPSFSPSVAGVGIFPITFSYVDSTTGCSDSAVQNITIHDCAGIEETADLNDVSLYPNPTNGMFTISLANTSAVDLNILITDMQGRMIVNTEEKNVAPAFSKQIDLKNLTKGIYMVRLSLGTQMMIKKLIVE